MLAGTLIVLLLYVALNAVFLLTAPMSELAGQLQVASISGRQTVPPERLRVFPSPSIVTTPVWPSITR